MIKVKLTENYTGFNIEGTYYVSMNKCDFKDMYR